MSIAIQLAGEATQTIVGIADAAAHIQDVVRHEKELTEATAISDDNEFNIRKNFLDNTVNAIKEATCSQFNIVICTDQEHDDFQNLKGRILPMDLVTVDVAKNKPVDFQVYVFDTGNYLRHGKYELDHWNWFGETKKWYDPAAMHVDFDKAQPKLDAAAIKAKQDQNAAQNKTAAAATGATSAVQASTAAKQAPALDRDAAGKAAAAAQAQPASAPAPGLMDHLAGVAAGPLSQMVMGGIAKPAATKGKKAKKGKAH